MTALTKPTPITEPVGGSAPLQVLSIPMKAATIIYKGAFVVFDAGYAAPARTATGLVAAGRAEETVDNSAGSAGALRITVRRGAFVANNHTGGDAVVQASAGSNVYFLDDNTVTVTSTGRSVAGKFIAFNDAGRPIVEIL
jgi:hypothetical protein